MEVLRWKEILKIALDVLERQKDNVPFSEWMWGGGSALSMRYGHRDSRDVDIFLWDAQFLTFFTPRLNDDLERIARDYDEMSNFVKVWLEGDSQIDFIVAPSLTDDPCEVLEVMGKKIQVETPWETAVKKLFYRATDLKVRDVIDIARILRDRKAEKKVRENFPVFRTRTGLLRKRLREIETEWERGMEGLVVYDRSLADPDVVREVEHFLMTEVPAPEIRRREPEGPDMGP